MLKLLIETWASSGMKDQFSLLVVRGSEREIFP